MDEEKEMTLFIPSSHLMGIIIPSISRQSTYLYSQFFRLVWGIIERMVHSKSYLKIAKIEFEGEGRGEGGEG